MSTQHVVVDGSNLATEGRSTPSLAQLEQAVAELRKEMPEAEVTVVVDATFAHRIDSSELERFEAEERSGTYVHPPAGAIGRGDAFLLRIAEKVDGVVLSNDSFQEFHGEHGWLFDRGRLIGAMPVPGVGWIFVPRTPVRGERSRVAVRSVDRARAQVERAIAEATKEAVSTKAETRTETAGSTRSAVRSAPQAVNDPMTFITFIAEHRLGDEVEAEVESFTSHGAVARIGDVRGYVPLAGLGDPAPKSAREVLKRGQHRTFLVSALDPYRRGVELVLPGLGEVSGHPSAETVAAEVKMARSGFHRIAWKKSPNVAADSRDDAKQTPKTTKSIAKRIVKGPDEARTRTRVATKTTTSETKAQKSVAAGSNVSVQEPATSAPPRRSRFRRRETKKLRSDEAVSRSMKRGNLAW